MLVHPWDAPLDDAEWRTWLSGHDFGQLIAAGRGRDVPLVLPTHFVYDGATTLEIHLARPNPVWPVLDENPTVLFTVIGDYVYVPSAWGAAPGTPPERGIPTSFYASVQLTCTATLVDDPVEKAALLRRQLAHFQPEGGFQPVEADDPYYARLFPQIRGLRLEVQAVRGKFKYGGNKAVEHRHLIAGRLAERNGPMDGAARTHLLRRTESGESAPAGAPTAAGAPAAAGPGAAPAGAAP